MNTGLSPAQARDVLRAVPVAICQALLSGQSVELPKLGRWSLHST